jgi:hypothetical protein
MVLCRLCAPDRFIVNVFKVVRLLDIFFCSNISYDRMSLCGEPTNRMIHPIIIN